MQPRKIALINQPFGTVSPKLQRGSIAIWVYQMAQQLTKTHNITIYARQVAGEATQEVADGITYRRFSVSVDKVLAMAQDWWGGRQLVDKRPSFASPAYYRSYITRIARDIHQQQIDVVHINNFFQFVPIIRRYNPQAKIILHMQCEWLTQISPTIVQPILDQLDAVS
ncbi:MAG: glycosyltransferase, partial [Chloroflexota bacterium]